MSQVNVWFTPEGEVARFVVGSLAALGVQRNQFCPPSIENMGWTVPGALAGSTSV